MGGHSSQERRSGERSTADLVRDVAEATSHLVRDELRLATAEMRVKTRRVGLGAGLAGAASLCALLAVMVLVAAAVLAIALVLPGWLAALIVAGSLLAIAAVAAALGKFEIGRATPAMPEKAVASIHEDVEAVRGSVRQ